MNDSIMVRTKTNFAAVPNDFAQNPKISIEAKGVALFLQSLPDNWEIHPIWVQKQLNIKDWTWRKVSNELKKHGCLKLYKGGNDRGSFYMFDLWETKDKLQKPETLKTNGSAETLESRDSENQRVGSIYNKKTKINKKTTTTKKQLRENVVVVLESLKIDKSSYEKIAEYEESYILEKTKLVATNKNLNNPTGYLLKALVGDWHITSKPHPISPYPSIEETKLMNLPPKGPRTLDPKEQMTKVREALKPAYTKAN